MNAWSVLCNPSNVEGRLTRDKRKEALTQTMARAKEEQKSRREAEVSLRKEKEDFLFFYPLLNGFIIVSRYPAQERRIGCFSAVRGVKKKREEGRRCGDRNEWVLGARRMNSRRLTVFGYRPDTCQSPASFALARFFFPPAFSLGRRGSATKARCR